MTRAHQPIRTWRRLWLTVRCRCGLRPVRGQCPVDVTPIRLGDGDVVPLPRTPLAEVVEEKTRVLPVVYPRLNFLTRGQEWRGNGGRWPS